MKNSFRSAVSHLAHQPKLLALAAVIAVGASLTVSLPALQGQTSFLGIGPQGNTGIGGASNGTTTTQGQTGVAPSGTTAGTQGQTGNSNGTTAGTQGQTGTTNGTTSGTQGTAASNGAIALSNPIIINDGAFGYTAPVVVRTVGFSGNSRTIVPNVWAFNSVTPGTFDVYVTWIAAPTNSTATTYSLSTKVGDVRTLVGTFTVDQTQEPTDATHTGGSKWKKLTRVTITTGQKLELTGAIERNAYIDAVALQRIPFADVTVSKTAPATVGPGGTVVYTLTIRNAGTDTANSVRLTDPIPAGLDFIPTTGSNCTESGAAVICSNITISPNQSKTITLRYAVSPDELCNAVITSGLSAVSTATQETDSTNNQSLSVSTNVLCSNGDLGLSMSGPDSGTVVLGQTLAYTATVVNRGATQVTGTINSIRIPAGLVLDLALSPNCVKSGNAVRCGEIVVAGNGSATRTITFTVVATSTCPRSIGYLARVSGNVTDLNLGNNDSDAVSTNVSCQ